MPHVHIKHLPKDFTDRQKDELSAAVTAVVVEHFGTYDGAVSIALEPVPRTRWTDSVLVAEVERNAHLIVKRPDYK